MDEIPPIPNEFRRVQTAHLWGELHRVIPAIVEQHLGNGRRLIRITPLNTRPNYYLIRVDSRWSMDSDDWYDHLEEIYEAITEEFGEKEREREYLADDLREQGIEPTAENTDLAGNEDRLGWPVLSLDSGCCWSHICFLRRRKKAVVAG